MEKNRAGRGFPVVRENAGAGALERTSCEFSTP